MTALMEPEVGGEPRDLWSREPWMANGKCLGLGTKMADIFYPAAGENTKQAKRMCAVCPVRTECLDYALEHGEVFGIWGGYTEADRRRLKRQRRSEAE